MKKAALKTYKTFKAAAAKNPENLPIVKVGELYIVGLRGLDEVTVIAPEGRYNGHITMRKLAAIGNGNHAKPDAATMPANFKGEGIYHPDKY